MAAVEGPKCCFVLQHAAQELCSACKDRMGHRAQVTDPSIIAGLGVSKSILKCLMLQQGDQAEQVIVVDDVIQQAFAEA